MSDFVPEPITKFFKDWQEYGLEIAASEADIQAIREYDPELASMVENAIDEVVNLEDYMNMRYGLDVMEDPDEDDYEKREDDN